MRVTKLLKEWFEGLRFYYQICCMLSILHLACIFPDDFQEV